MMAPMTTAAFASPAALALLLVFQPDIDLFPGVIRAITMIAERYGRANERALWRVARKKERHVPLSRVADWERAGYLVSSIRSMDREGNVTPRERKTALLNVAERAMRFTLEHRGTRTVCLVASSEMLRMKEARTLSLSLREQHVRVVSILTDPTEDCPEDILSFVDEVVMLHAYALSREIRTVTLFGNTQIEESDTPRPRDQLDVLEQEAPEAYRMLHAILGVESAPKSIENMRTYLRERIERDRTPIPPIVIATLRIMQRPGNPDRFNRARIAAELREQYRVPETESIAAIDILQREGSLRPGDDLDVRYARHPDCLAHKFARELWYAFAVTRPERIMSDLIAAIEYQVFSPRLAKQKAREDAAYAERLSAMTAEERAREYRNWGLINKSFIGRFEQKLEWFLRETDAKKDSLPRAS